MSEVTDSACPDCRDRAETFSYLGGAYLFDVAAASGITSDGRAPVEVDDESVRQTVGGLNMVTAHLDHIDPAAPGIIAHVCIPDPSGELLRGHVLIHGDHTAARCLRDGRPFFAHLLSEAESEAVLLRRPPVAAL